MDWFGYPFFIGGKLADTRAPILWLIPQETGFAGLRPPPPSRSKPDNCRSRLDRPFVPGFPLSVFGASGLCEHMVSLAVISAPLSPHPKIPFPAHTVQQLISGASRTGNGRLNGVGSGCVAAMRYCCGCNPSASNCWLHSAGASRSRSMLIPRGRRPSTAARTSLGARKASEMVMLT